MKKSIVALAASTLLIGMSVSAIPAFAADTGASDASSSAPAKHHGHMKAHHGHKKSHKKAESSSAAPK